jgi:type I restriction enzyme, R subunit
MGPNARRLVWRRWCPGAYILGDIGAAHREGTFAIIIDEAHSSQGGKATVATSTSLSAAGGAEDDETLEDLVNRLMEAKKMLPNASYFAFTATPKNKTLEIFGEPFDRAGKTAHRPFHSYTMKQAIQERFISTSWPAMCRSTATTSSSR